MSTTEPLQDDKYVSSKLEEITRYLGPKPRNRFSLLWQPINFLLDWLIRRDARNRLSEFLRQPNKFMLGLSQAPIPNNHPKKYGMSDVKNKILYIVGEDVIDGQTRISHLIKAIDDALEEDDFSRSELAYDDFNYVAEVYELLEDLCCDD